jgi:UDP-N-acetylglucosamine--N-acetylmuramyl-(pentapeptide) pyrophosphoryl-undecaprenol N-acetylglucosamine transferase
VSAQEVRKPTVLLAAGGTGGHLFPAEALAAALARRGVATELATDDRAARYGGSFPPETVHIIPSDTFRSRSPGAVVRTGATLAWGVARALILLRRLQPAAVIGFGGYPTIPPVMAAGLARIPSLIHEQNAVMGRANRLLASRVTAIATGFPGVVASDAALAAKATHTGNPVRPAVIAAAQTPYPEANGSGRIRLLVFGGSQGARVMSEVVPPAVAGLYASMRSRLSVVQQARAEDAEAVHNHYQRLGVEAEVEPFFSDLPARMAAAHFVIARSGASTVAELAAIGRPGILVPLPHALDQDQLANARVLERAGAAVVMTQDQFTPERLTRELAALTAEPARAAAMAEAARSAGAIDAADRVAELVLRVAHVIPARV